ncbi:MAG: hypothetical protein GZ087_11405 [Flavobacterium sp.]|nr:hypothetical protein [Flavobacterium sp.]
MEKVNDFIFQVDSDLVKKVYFESENIMIIDDQDTTSNLCVIYFSSNELYYPNTKSSFTNAILKRDKYEWSNNRFPDAKRHIFVRDIQKQWYIEGVSAKMNTPKLVAEHLIKLCKDYIVFTIGSSAGGFAALLFGSIIKAKRVYAFNSQLDLTIIIKNSNAFVDPILFKYLQDDSRLKCYKIANFMTKDIKYFYFQSANSKMDIDQYNTCSEKNLLKKIEFATSNHGFPFLRHNLLYVLRLSENELEEMTRHNLHPFIFSVKIDGFCRAFYLSSKAVLKRLKKKWYDEKNIS